MLLRLQKQIGTSLTMPVLIADFNFIVASRERAIKRQIPLAGVFVKELYCSNLSPAQVNRQAPIVNLGIPFPESGINFKSSPFYNAKL